MDAREEIKRIILLLPQLAAESNDSEIKADIDLLMGVASQLVTALVNRNAALAKQKNPQKSKPPKPAPPPAANANIGAGAAKIQPVQSGSSGGSKSKMPSKIAYSK